MKTSIPVRNFSKALSTTIFVIFVLTGSLMTTPARTQIYEPEGLNMPGAWNEWTNPPANNLALASNTQVTDGRIVKISTGTPRWQTILKVAATGGDLTEGTYEWLFTSGPSSNAFQNKWAAVTVVTDSLQTYTKEGAANNSISLENGKWYTMNWEDIGYADTRAIFMKTSSEPVSITSVSVPAMVNPETPVTIEIWMNQNTAPEERVYVRYSIDGWATSSVSEAGIAGMMATATIPGFPDGTVVSYYALTTTKAGLLSDFDMFTIHLNNNEGVNYTYTVTPAAPTITFANLQWPGSGSIPPSSNFEVYGQVYIQGITGQGTLPSGLLAWLGYSTENSEPSGWNNWIDAAFNASTGNNDEFEADLGIVIPQPGRYYYAFRYKYNDNPFVYGGFSATGGGFWDGEVNISGVLDVITGLEGNRNGITRIYPNPTSDLVWFNLSEKSRITLLDVRGVVMTEQVFPAGQHHIDIRDIHAGAYLMKITGDRTSTCRTIIKQ